MAWKRSSAISGTSLRRQGLDAAIAAGLVCREAERLYPGLFHAVSVKNKVLHVTVVPGGLLAVKNIEGKLIEQLTVFSKDKPLPPVARLRISTDLS